MKLSDFIKTKWQQFRCPHEWQTISCFYIVDKTGYATNEMVGIEKMCNICDKHKTIIWGKGKK